MQNGNIASGIYCIENMINNKKYIGQSKNIDDRWRKHKGELNRGVHDNDYLQKSWNKNGSENFKFYVLEYCDVDELDDKERYYIDLHNTLNRDCGYNLKTGGQDNGVCASEYVRNMISNALKRAYAESEDLRQQSRDNALKQWANPEIKAKILGENNGMYGKHHTEETRKKMSKMKKGKPSPKQNMIPVYNIELDKAFTNATEAGKELSLHGSTILQVCYGNRKTCGGYHWKFLLENNI